MHIRSCAHDPPAENPRQGRGHEKPLAVPEGTLAAAGYGIVMVARAVRTDFGQKRTSLRVGYTRRHALHLQVGQRYEIVSITL